LTMKKHRFVFTPPMEATSWEAFNQDFAALPSGIMPSFTSPEECEVVSELGSAEIEDCIRALHLKHAVGEARPVQRAQ
jgi:hypothetical protein